MGKSEGINLEFSSMLEIDYLSKLIQLRKSKGGGFYGHKANHVILKDGEYVGDLFSLIEIAIKDYGIEDAEIANAALFDRMATDNLLKAAKGTGRPTVFLDLRIEGVNGYEPLGTLFIELFEDLCPKASENFALLCTGERGRDPKTDVTLSYEGSPVHRVVPGGWLQAGDILDGSGNHSISAFGGTFEDECFSVDFNCLIGGILGYSSNGPHSNGSQFFITLGPCEYLNLNKVGFGRVIHGYSVLREIEKVPCSYERPTKNIIIHSCGKYVI